MCGPYMWYQKVIQNWAAPLKEGLISRALSPGLTGADVSMYM